MRSSCTYCNKKTEHSAAGVCSHCGYKEGDKIEQCPCCDYYTLQSRGDYEICGVCNWEDEIVSLDMPSAPNHDITLRQARVNFKKYFTLDPNPEYYQIRKKPRKEWARFKHEPRELTFEEVVLGKTGANLSEGDK